jgi:hypothetical protein
MGHVRFKVEDQIVTAELIDQRTTTSRNTGKELFQLDVRFRVHENQRGFCTSALKTGSVTLLSSDGDATREITVGVYEKQHSYSSDNPIQSCVWMLSEQEDSTLESLQIGDLNITPYRYKDYFDQEALICTVCMKVDAATHDALRALPMYFPVVRRGISDQSRSMRFGLILWSSDDEETYKMQATLVEEVHDKPGRSHGFLEPMFTSVMDLLALTGARYTQLLDLLEAKGVLTAEERKKVGEIPDDELQYRQRQFYRLKDLDEWIELTEGESETAQTDPPM